MRLVSAMHRAKMPSASAPYQRAIMMLAAKATPPPATRATIKTDDLVSSWIRLLDITCAIAD